MLASWIGLRILCLGYCCVYAVWYQCFSCQDLLSAREL